MITERKQPNVLYICLAKYYRCHCDLYMLFSGHVTQVSGHRVTWIISGTKWEMSFNGTAKAVSHSMPRPCRAAKGLDCVFPIWFTQCGRVWFTLAMPRPCYAPPMPFFSRQRYSTSVERRPVGYLPAFGFFRLPRGVPRRLLSDAYQSQMQVASVKPNNVCHGRGKEW